MSNKLKRAIIEIRWGPLASRRAVIEPGNTLRVGRTNRADFVVPHDEMMSSLHLELEWNGKTCLLRSLNGPQGTLVNGAAADVAEVPHGAWIRAGMTDFSLYIEESTPPKQSSVATSTEAQLMAERVLRILQAGACDAPLFAVLDAAQGDRVLELLRESVETYQSLYEGIQGWAMEDAAPYLVHFSARSRLIERLVREGWGKNWGIYLTTRETFSNVRRHLRRFLLVEEYETRKRMYFRFYDPRVLRAFLPLCTTRQLFAIYDKINALLIEGSKGEVLQFTHEAGTLANDTLPY